jgi:MoaA/NifB/PqqE/SkfB family radical SAM enzyme
MNRPIYPLYVTINVTGICNLSCRYCYYQPRKSKAMEWSSFVRTIEELKENKVFLLNISGGEPFTHPRICEFLRLAHDKFDHVLLLSNGTILNPEHKNTINEIISKKGIFPIQISLDSIIPHINKRTRSYPGTIIKNIIELHNINAALSIAIVVSKFNIKTIAESIEFLSQYTKLFHLMVFQPVKALNGRDLECEVGDHELHVLFKSIKGLSEKLNLTIDSPFDEPSEKAIAYGAPCQAAFSHVAIDPDLEVRPCDKLTEISLGNLSKASLQSIWNSKEALQIVNQNIPICVQ